jgi:pyridoxamine 5'-phosphate oxidase
MSQQERDRKRREQTLDESQVAPDPFEQFERWFEEALAADLAEPRAMTLATASLGGVPSARMVLLRGFDRRGFVFYTNYESRKAGELLARPHAALVFYWAELNRQVRVSGCMSLVSADEADAYFRTRPVGSQLSAWASRQSQVVSSRTVLEARLAELTAEYEGREVPRPPFWGGFRVSPEQIEFWTSRPNRLHDRLRYTRVADGWRLERLSP